MKDEERRETLFQVGMVIAFYVAVAGFALEIFERTVSRGEHGITTELAAIPVLGGIILFGLIWRKLR